MPQPRPLRFLTHLGRFLVELWQFARANRAWWIVPVVLVLLAIAGLIVSVSTISPFIYTLF